MGQPDSPQLLIRASKPSTNRYHEYSLASEYQLDVEESSDKREEACLRKNIETRPEQTAGNIPIRGVSSLLKEDPFSTETSRALFEAIGKSQFTYAMSKFAD